ncbi:MAG: MobQ family relaxase [Bacillota bacterium]
MAIFYLNAQIIGRSAGRTATGAAAYRSGERIVDERTGQIFDYSRRRGEIEGAIYAPTGSPAWAQDRALLWNAAEKAERRADAQVAREVVIAFPKELSKEQQRELIAGYVREQFVARGMVADVAIHRNPGNPHAHIMLTMREMGPEGLSSKKNREWNKPEVLDSWREQWAAHANRALERSGREERIDHRSLAEQGSGRLPQVHLGPNAAAMERRGVATEKGEHNRLVAEHNAVVVDLEKARQERARQKAEQQVSRRYEARLNAGWAVAPAKALARLEYHDCGGRQLSWQETRHMFDETRQELHQVQTEIASVNREGQRLQEAARILETRQKASADLERLQSPVATIKRWFSDGARRGYQRARDLHDRLDTAAKRLGTGSDAELRQQGAEWESRKQRLPLLEERVASLSKTMELISKALEGFRREYEREQDQLHHQRRKRAREVDRGR